ncbi:MAG TPA: metallophosphoesterase [Gemmatimonadaceae bacterium]|nr:metallophosphoesterase [Gemmatimonadaceae bacterium]
MTTILHVSDLHFGKPAVPEQIEAIEDLIRDSDGRFDVVAISGDVSQRSRAGEFQRARAFIRQAQRVSRTIVVPGNHDVKWWRAPLGVGDRASLYAGYRTYIAHELEPVLRVPGATIVGLNSAHGVTRHTLTWNVRDIGIIGDLRRSQIERAREAFAAAPPEDARVVVVHHNPVKGELSQRHGLVNTRRVLGAFAELGVDVVLCGHDHQEAIHYVEHTRRGTVISTAGTVSNRSRGGRPSSLNTIDITHDAILVTTAVWSREEQRFVPGRPHRFARG